MVGVALAAAALAGGWWAWSLYLRPQPPPVMDVVAPPRPPGPEPLELGPPPVLPCEYPRHPLAPTGEVAQSEAVVPFVVCDVPKERRASEPVMTPKDVTPTRPVDSEPVAGEPVARAAKR